MVRTATLAVISTFVLVALIQDANGLKCYTCLGKECNDPFTPTEAMKSNCPAELNACSKVTTQGNIVRSCSKKGICVPGKGVTCEECSTDLCNTASQHGSTAIFLALSVAIIYAFL